MPTHPAVPSRLDCTPKPKDLPIQPQPAWRRETRESGEPPEEEIRLLKLEIRNKFKSPKKKI
jgi:hypothetical protein